MLHQLTQMGQGILPVEWAVFSGLVLLGLIYWQWRRLRFFILRIWYEVPLIGKLATLARSDHKDPGTDWYAGETELCSDFYRYLPEHATATDFENATVYLERARELDRKPLSRAGWAVVLLLLVAEALSFGVLLAGYAAQNSTLSEQNRLGYIVAFVLAILMLILTHLAGRELYVNSLRAKVREWWGGDGPLRPSGEVSLNHNRRDDGKPIWLQLANRLDGGRGGKYLPNFVVTALACVAIAGIGSGAFYLRTEVLRSLMIDQTLGSAGAGFEAGCQGDIFNCLSKVTEKANKKGVMESRAAQGAAAETAFAILSLIFVIMQAIGIATGYFFGFAGVESKEAAEIRGGCATVDEFMRVQIAQREYVSRIAESKLQRLQRRILRTGIAEDSEAKRKERTFRNYVLRRKAEQRADAAAEREDRSGSAEERDLALDSGERAPSIRADALGERQQQRPVGFATATSDRERIDGAERPELVSRESSGDGELRAQIEALKAQLQGMTEILADRGAAQKTGERE